MKVYDAGIALMEGRFSDGEALAREALHIGRRIEHPYARACYNSQISALARDLGDPERAIEHLIRGLRNPQGPVHWVKAILGRCHLVLGRRDEALAFLDDLARRDFEDLPRAIRWNVSMAEIAGLCAELGDSRRADTLCDHLIPVERHNGVLPLPICYAGPMTYHLARLFELLGRSDEAGQLYEDALDTCTALAARPFQARVRLAWARLLQRTGDRARGRALIDEAARGAGELGMARLAAEIEAFREKTR